MKRIVIIVLSVVAIQSSFAQLLTPVQYVEKYKDLAIREMKRMGVPAAITLAQGLLETENGNSALVKKSNNHFGIKCKNTWTGDGVSHDDDAPGECFRTYKDAEASYRDHSNFLRGRDHYAFLFQLDPADYKGWAYGLKKAGYATNPKYPAILIKSIEQYNLQQYTLAGINDVPRYEKGKYEDDKEELVLPDNNFSGDNNLRDEEDLGDITEQESSINGKRCVFAKKGMSLLAIATRNNINLNKFLDINELAADGILENDQVLFLEKKSKTGEKDFYIAQADETMHDIAQKKGIQLQSLLEYNGLAHEEEVAPGKKLNLKPVTAVYREMVAETKTIPAKLYEVQPKEGLYSIAKKFGVSVQQLKEWNNLETGDLKLGQQLVVSK